MSEDEQIITIHTKHTFKHRLSAFFANPKKRLLFIIISGLILIGAVGTGLYFMNKGPGTSGPKKDIPVELKTQEMPKFYNILDGTETDESHANLHPLGVMVENHVDARPQAGLDKASIVYEAIAEGGITRFLTLFSSKDADKVGPTRSARTYYVDWALGYNAYLAHVGGNYDALEQIVADKVLDLDQFKYSSPYWREPKVGLSSEHTMYTSTLKLRDQANSLKYSTENKFILYKFTDVVKAPAANTKDKSPEPGNTAVETPIATEPAASKINVNFSSVNYNVIFNYDPATNTYKRTLGGKVQLDKETKAEISPTNLIVMTVKRAPTVTKINEQGYTMTTVGEGAAKIFINGKEIDGKWVKSSKTSREIFYDNNNQEITFNRGQFWICVIPPDSSVTFQ